MRAQGFVPYYMSILPEVHIRPKMVASLKVNELKKIKVVIKDNPMKAKMKSV